MSTSTKAPSRARGHSGDFAPANGDVLAAAEVRGHDDVLLDGDPIPSSDRLSSDAGFARYADFSSIYDLVNARDVPALVDAALLTAEAERVLQRQHRSGVTAADLLGLAQALAAQDADGDAADRIRSAGAIAKIAVPQFAQAQAAVCQRMRQTAPSIPADVAPEAFELFHGMTKDAKTAMLLGDVRRLERVRQAAEGCKRLTPEMKSQLAPWLQDVARAGAASADQMGGSKLPALLDEAPALASAIFYEHSWGGGATYTIQGAYVRSNMPDGWNDVVSSLWVRRGFLVYAYQHVNYGGARCWVLVERDGTPASSPVRQKTQEGAGHLFEMSSHNWNDVISSFQVQNR